jgi:anti-sigma regulatory factor (Ser/Thr protein kinase)
MAEPLRDRTVDAERLTVLAEAARAVHAERDPARAIAWVLDATRRLTGLSDVAVCSLPRHGSPTWTAAAESDVDFTLVADPRVTGLLRNGLDTGEPMVLADLAEAERALPPEDRLRRIVPLASLLVVPVIARDGLAQAAILAGSATPAAIDDDTVEAVVALAAHLGVALDNSATLARMEEVEARGKEVVHALQEAVRPPAPAVPFVELGVHYVAADPSAPTGGDLYDWTLLPDGDLHLAIVDVMGKGVEATKHALAVTHALRLLAVEGCPLGEIVARTDALLTAHNPELVATLLVARYRPGTGDLLLAGAGHPPALIVSDGQVREVTAPGIPLGWPGAGSADVVAEHLDRSDTLIFYTDGLIEATKDILQGLADLREAAAATASYPATSLARALVDRQLAGAARHDDSVALVLRRRAPAAAIPSHPLPPFSHQFSPQPAAVPIARHLLHDWLVRVPVESDGVDAILLAVSELCSNAVRHATGAPTAIALQAWTQGDDVFVEVSDDGGTLIWPDAPSDERPDPDAEQGRGLFLVRELADEVTSSVENGRSAVRIAKRAVVSSAAEAGVPAPARG